MTSLRSLASDRRRLTTSSAPLPPQNKNAAQPSMVPSNPNSDVVARIHEILGSDATSANASLKGSHWLHS